MLAPNTVTLVAGAGVWLSRMQSATPVAPPPPPTPPPLPRRDAVLVLGASGRVGRRVVAKLLQAGRTVVAASRSSPKTKQVLADIGVKEGLQEVSKKRSSYVRRELPMMTMQIQDSSGILFFEEVDVTNPESVGRPETWRGITQVRNAPLK